MQLRNRTIVSSNISVPMVVSTNVPPRKIVPTNVPHRQVISRNNSICQIINNSIRIVSTIENNKKLSEEEIFISKIRLYRELFYMIEYYDLKSNPHFSDKFIPVVIEKANHFITELNSILISNGCFGKTRISPRNQKMYIIKEFVDELKLFILT
jgi:hypothetical protein